MSFDYSYFVASFDKEKRQGSIYQVTAGLNPQFVGSAATLSSDYGFQYWTDYTSSFVLLEKNGLTPTTT